MAGQDYVPAFLPGHQLSCIAGANITQGQLVYVSGNTWPNPTVSPTSAATAEQVGVAAATAASGQPVSVYFKGVHVLTSTGTINAGDPVMAAAAGAVAEFSGTTYSQIIGRALAAAASNAVPVMLG
ncbi:hypothetical protein AWC11_07270 [Mycobacterium interjectum]|nr:hypothetical protein AWC11_07270 [Mycobacterium interjectum]